MHWQQCEPEVLPLLPSSSPGPAGVLLYFPLLLCRARDMWPKPRLGKRSPLSAPYPAGGAPTGRHPAEGSAAWATGARQPGSSRVKGHPVLKLCLQHGGGGGRGGGGGGGFEPAAVISELPPPSERPASASIDVPGRRGRSREAEVDVDELMVAMVLSSLSGSPLLHGPAHMDAAVPPIDCGGSELSHGGSSSSSSGCWSGWHGTGSPATPPDDGLDAEPVLVPLNEPAAHKRKNSNYRCLWPSCDKALTTIVGIRRHIRITHLSGDRQRSEEDFYYTEASQWESPPPPPLPLPCSPARLSSPPSTRPPSPALSRSAPSSLGASWQVQSEHSYQGQASRPRSILAEDQWLQQHSSAPCRRLRGEAKKCRRVYGIEQRERWCTSCRWKKACQRFLS
ncbi:zinc finger protein 395-like isoform X2 [Nelusetta ayraudi]|uniref:zinc finger protein 395-like isoform X2 n=1 Tax=Nelusetta ayraudi TaxID=303726 RepID=UPI003F6F6ECD